MNKNTNCVLKNLKIFQNLINLNFCYIYLTYLPFTYLTFLGDEIGFEGVLREFYLFTRSTIETKFILRLSWRQPFANSGIFQYNIRWQSGVVVAIVVVIEDYVGPPDLQTWNARLGQAAEVFRVPGQPVVRPDRRDEHRGSHLLCLKIEFHLLNP